MQEGQRDGGVMSVSEDGVGRAAAWLKGRDSHGFHRTGTVGDEAGAAWLAAETAKLGVTPTAEEFALHRLDPIAAYLEIGPSRIAAVPVFDAPATGAGGVSGRLGLAGSTAAVGVVELSPHAVYGPDYAERRREPGTRLLSLSARECGLGWGC